MSSTQRPSKRLTDALHATWELAGNPRLSDAAARVMLAELSRYPEDAVLKALARAVREVTGRLSLAHIIERIDDGRPSADEAWATVGTTDESRTLVTTKEAIHAMEVCRDLLADDGVGARMAFRERYNTIVSENRERGIPVEWYASLGTDRNGRAAVLAAAVQQGRLTAEYAAQLTGATPEELVGLAAGKPRPALPAPPVVTELARSLGPPPCGKDPSCDGWKHALSDGTTTRCPIWGSA